MDPAASRALPRQAEEQPRHPLQHDGQPNQEWVSRQGSDQERPGREGDSVTEVADP